MTDRNLRLLTVALASAGVGIAAYLSYASTTKAALMCPTSGCDRVRQSSYSTLAGLPVAYLGAAGYALILGSAASANVRAALTGAALSLVGSAFALYLLVIQLGVIHAVCVWCVASDAVLLVVTALAIVRLRAAMRRR